MNSVLPCDSGDISRILDRLEESDAALAGQAFPAEQLVFKAADGNGRMVAGCAAESRGGVLTVESLWVGERYRRLGMGRALLHAAERAGIERGCRLARVDTFDFLAAAFYEHLGYAVFNTTGDFPPGHVQLNMMKPLDPAAGPIPAAQIADARFSVRPGSAGERTDLFWRLLEYSCSLVPSVRPFETFNRKITAGDGALIAGCLVDTSSWNAAAIRALWVGEAWRRRGLGTLLLREVERAAGARGFDMLLLDIADWQGKAFFEKCGFVTSAALPDCPKGHRRYFLRKRICL